MSGRSINSRLQVLEERLVAQRPRARPRDRLELSAIPSLSATQAVAVETEAKIREVYKMSGVLTVDGRRYRSNAAADLRHLGELGNGTCGHVVKMLHAPSGTVVAVKQMRRSGNSEENKRILMDLEVVLRSHGCPYIVRCLGYFITEADVWICMELMASCFDKILKRLGGPLPEDILGKLTVATVEALSYLKVQHDVIHRDVKPSNILVDQRGVIKLCDFGISGRLVDSKAKTRGAGCAAYMAPERINPPDPQKPDYDIRADVWSLGITLVELATGVYPYRDCTNDFEVLTRVIEEAPPALPDEPRFSDHLRCFVRQCLIKDYRNRPKYAALLAHPFVRRAVASDVCVGSWLAEALPPGSPRSTETPPVFRRACRPTAEDSDLSLNGLSLNPFSDGRRSGDGFDELVRKADCGDAMFSNELKVTAKDSESFRSKGGDVAADPDRPTRAAPDEIPAENGGSVERPPEAEPTAPSPSTASYFANLERRNRPFSGGGPSERTRPFGSPDVGARRYFSPARGGEDEPPPPPRFGPDGASDCFAACRFPGVRAFGNGNEPFYSGSRSQPASLEAYGDARHSSRSYSRTPEKSFSPPLRSPQPAHRWAVREREERERDSWRSENSRRQQGNTSPIVLQRFYHQQGQRRSRRDWDCSSRQSNSSLSRDASVGRSPEPPRRVRRDPSLPRRESPSAPADVPDHKFYNNNAHSARADERPLLREWRERERTQSEREEDLRLQRERLVGEADAQFESKIEVYRRRAGDERNGDCRRAESETDERTSAEDDSRFRRPKRGKNGDERGSGGPSPSGAGCSGKRPTPLPRRVAAADVEDLAGRTRDASRSFVRVSGVPPQPPPRRTTDSWSLPASPLPSRPF